MPGYSIRAPWREQAEAARKQRQESERVGAVVAGRRRRNKEARKSRRTNRKRAH